MEMIERMMSAFGGFGMNIQDKRQKECLDKFNKVCLEFALKLDGAVGIEKPDSILKIVVNIAKHSDSSIVDNFNRMLISRKQLFEQRRPEFLNLFPIKAKPDFNDLDNGTKKSIWQYFDSMAKHARDYKDACEANPIDDLKNLKLGGLFGSTISDIKGVLKKNNVDFKKCFKVLGEVMDVLPIDSLVQEVPSGALPTELGIDISELKQDVLKKQLIAVLENVFCGDEDDE